MTMTMTTPRRKHTDCLRQVWEALNLFPWSPCTQLVELTGFPSGTVHGRLAELEELGLAKSTLRPGLSSTGRKRNVRHYHTMGEVYVAPTRAQRYATRKAGQGAALVLLEAEHFDLKPVGALPARSNVVTPSVSPPCPPSPTTVSINLADLDVNILPLGVALELYIKLHNALETVRSL